MTGGLDCSLEPAVEKCRMKFPAVSGAFDFDEAVVESSRPAQIGERLARHLVGVAAVRRELLPPDRQTDDEPFARFISDAGAHLHRATVVEDAQQVAIAYVSGVRVGGVDVEMRLAFRRAQT